MKGKRIDNLGSKDRPRGPWLYGRAGNSWRHHTSVRGWSKAKQVAIEFSRNHPETKVFLAKTDDPIEGEGLYDIYRKDSSV